MQITPQIYVIPCFDLGDPSLQSRDSHPASALRPTYTLHIAAYSQQLAPTHSRTDGHNCGLSEKKLFRSFILTRNPPILSSALASSTLPHHWVSILAFPSLRIGICAAIRSSYWHLSYNEAARHISCCGYSKCDSFTAAPGRTVCGAC